MSRLILAHTRDILTTIYSNQLIYRIPLYFKEEAQILQKASYLELVIPEKVEDVSCKVIHLYKESVFPVKTENLK